jgi:hypothetical protein
LGAQFTGRGRKREGREREGAKLRQPAMMAIMAAAVTSERRGGEGTAVAFKMG